MTLRDRGTSPRHDVVKTGGGQAPALHEEPLAGGGLVRGTISIDGRLKACVFAAWLTLGTAVVVSNVEGSGRVVTICAILAAAFAGLLRRDWREGLAVGLAGAALTAWLVSG